MIKKITLKTQVILLLIILFVFHLKNIIKYIDATHKIALDYQIDFSIGLYLKLFSFVVLYFIICFLSILELFRKQQKKLGFYLISFYLTNEILMKFYIPSFTIIYFIKIICIIFLIIIINKKEFQFELKYSKFEKSIILISALLVNLLIILFF
jgi:hypothetical protein